MGVSLPARVARLSFSKGRFNHTLAVELGTQRAGLPTAWFGVSAVASDHRASPDAPGTNYAPRRCLGDLPRLQRRHKPCRHVVSQAVLICVRGGQAGTLLDAEVNRIGIFLGD